MLRAALLILGLAMLAAALVGAIAGMMTVGLAVAGAFLVLALLFDRYRYKPVHVDRPGPGWEKTAERFQDPVSGQTVAVWFHRGTGERRYVADGDR